MLPGRAFLDGTSPRRCALDGDSIWKFPRAIPDLLIRRHIFGCTDSRRVLFATRDIRTRIDRMFAIVARTDHATAVFAEAIGMLIFTVKTVRATLVIRADARDLVAPKRNGALIGRACRRDAFPGLADLFCFASLAARAAVIDRIQLDAVRIEFIATIRIAIIELTVACRNILVILNTAFGVRIFKTMYMAVVEAAATELRVRHRHASFFILNHAELLPCAALGQLARIGIGREQRAALILIACQRLTMDPVFHQMCIARRLVLRVITSRLSVEHAPDFPLATDAFTVAAQRHASLAVVALIIRTCKRFTAASAASTAVRIADRWRDASSAAQYITIRTAAVVALVPVATASGAPIKRSAHFPYLITGFRAT